MKARTAETWVEKSKHRKYAAIAEVHQFETIATKRWECMVGPLDSSRRQ